MTTYHGRQTVPRHISLRLVFNSRHTSKEYFMIWSINDLNDSLAYKLCLCHSPDGKREFKLCEIGASCFPNTIFCTTQIPLPLLKKRDLVLISEEVLLEGGEHFHVDPHGIWFTESEVRQRRNVTRFSDIEWSTNTPPNLPQA